MGRVGGGKRGRKGKEMQATPTTCNKYKIQGHKHGVPEVQGKAAHSTEGSRGQGEATTTLPSTEPSSQWAGRQVTNKARELG